MGAPAANILKQQLISIGGDAAVHRDVITGAPERSSVFIVADRRRLGSLSRRLANQPFGLSEIGREIDSILDRLDAPTAGLALPNGPIAGRDLPMVMGVLNVTPDSFSDGGDFEDPDAALSHALRMVEAGADIVDVGGESSRPGAAQPPVEEELRRVLPVIERLAGHIDAPVSIDTRRAVVAREAAARGASIINDISGLTHDPGMMDAVRETGCAVVVMHMRGSPETMQNDPAYEDPVGEILEWLRARTGEIEVGGIPAGKIIVDPGIGFGKRLSDNLAIVREIAAFHGLGYPVLAGFSRKSFIGEITGRDARGRLCGGMAALEGCLRGGVQIVRVHDVPETVDYIRVSRAIRGEEAGR